MIRTQRSFRDVLGRFTTGVVLITADTPAGPAGMAANSFTSVSLSPPMVALCAAHTSTTWPAIRDVGSFAVTILGREHEGVCRLFATRNADRFGGRAWGRTEAGHPLLDGGLGWLDCRIRSTHRAGDHDLVVADALDWSLAADTEPLVFHSGRYARLAS